MSKNKLNTKINNGKTATGNNIKQFKPNKKIKCRVNELKGRAKHTDNKYIQLTEDIFGELVDKFGKRQTVKRFTWRNHNKIKIQVITYGARITSMKLPCYKGVVEDIILGFDNLDGYVYNNNLHLGAMLGRFGGRIENSRFKLDGKWYVLTKNDRSHHSFGGQRGFDKVNWVPHVDGNRVILSYFSPYGEEGYPGNLNIAITFEMTSTNQFSIDITAISTKPTILNITNFTYFNLAGHSAGSAELYKHEVTVNSNTFTPSKINGFPMGIIKNVIETDYDFQVPKKLGEVIGINPNDGFDVNLCVNRNSNGGNCFVASLFHPKTGRILEIYSNQYGVNVTTANDFELGRVVGPDPHKLLEEMYTCGDACEFFDEVQIQELYLNTAEDLSTRDSLESRNAKLSQLSTGLFDRKVSTGESIREIAQKEKRVKKIAGEHVICSCKSEALRDSKIPFCTDGKIRGKWGNIYKKHGGICFQTQNYPNAINHKNFPNCVLRPGQIYQHTILYKFWIKPPSLSHKE